MKKIFLVITLCLCTLAQAQYFTHRYGTPGDELQANGVNTNATNPGHFIAARSRNMFGPAISAACTNNFGSTVPVPFFSREYFIFDLAGNQLDVYNPKVFELDNGTGFGIIGRYLDVVSTTTTSSGIFYLQLDPNGNVMNVFSYRPNPWGTINYEIEEIGGISESINTTDLYITGTATYNAAANATIFALKINVNTGAPVWSQIYDIANPWPATAWFFGKDITENPVAPFGPPSAVIVGHVWDQNPGALVSDAYILHIDAATGVLVGPIVIHGTAFTWDIFNSVTQASATPTGLPPGFVIGGSNDMNGSTDFWLQRVDPVGFPILFTFHDNSQNPGAVDVCYDVIERLNTTANYEFYAGGYTDMGTIAQEDAMVIKTNDALMGVAGGEFTYGGPLNDRAASLDQFNGTAFDGLSTFGTYGVTAANTDMYIVKSYFNGVLGCGEQLNTPNSFLIPTWLGGTGGMNVSNFSTNNLNSTFNPAGSVPICMGTTPGSNARVGAKPVGDKQGLVSPNPVMQGAPAITIQLEHDMPAEVEIAIYDMLGRQYYTSTFMLAEGDNRLPVDISDINMKPGTYSVKVSGTTINQTIMLLVK